MPFSAGLYYFSHNPDQRDTPPVILIHGAGGNHLSWPADIRRLPGQRMLAVDLPGHGKTSGLGRQSIPEYSHTIMKFVDSMGFFKVVFIGHSMGGGIALQIALDYPERVAGLGLISTNSRLRVAQSLLDGLSHPSSFVSAIQIMVEWSLGPDVNETQKQLASRLLAETRPAVLQGDLLACNDFDVSQRLSEIHLPTLIVCGTEDRMTPIRFSEAMAVQIPGAALQTIDRAGHLVTLEQPRRVAGILNIFIKSINYIPGV